MKQNGKSQNLAAIAVALSASLLGGCFLILLLIGNSMHGGHSASHIYANSGNVQTAQNIVLDTETLKAQITTAVQQANDAEVQAVRMLDPTPLETVYTGEALRAESSKVEDLKSRGLFEVAELKSNTLDKWDISPDGTHARIHGNETWDLTVFTVSNQQHVAHETVVCPQTYYLVKQAGNGLWMVNTDLQDSASTYTSN